MTAVVLDLTNRQKETLVAVRRNVLFVYAERARFDEDDADDDGNGDDEDGRCNQCPRVMN